MVPKLSIHKDIKKKNGGSYLMQKSMEIKNQKFKGTKELGLVATLDCSKFVLIAAAFNTKY